MLCSSDFSGLEGCAFYQILAQKGPFGSQKAHIGFQKGAIHCWVISRDRLTPIWPSVVKKGTRAHLFRPKSQYFIRFWPSKEPFGSQKAHIGSQKGPIPCWIISNNRLKPIWLSVNTKWTLLHPFKAQIQTKNWLLGQKCQKYQHIFFLLHKA